VEQHGAAKADHGSEDGRLAKAVIFDVRLWCGEGCAV
jgi:hypothetical protein